MQKEIEIPWRGTVSVGRLELLSLAGIFQVIGRIAQTGDVSGDFVAALGTCPITRVQVRRASGSAATYLHRRDQLIGRWESEDQPVDGPPVCDKVYLGAAKAMKQMANRIGKCGFSASSAHVEGLALTRRGLAIAEAKFAKSPASFKKLERVTLAEVRVHKCEGKRKVVELKNDAGFEAARLRSEQCEAMLAELPADVFAWAGCLEVMGNG